MTDGPGSRRLWQSWLPSWLRHGLLAFLAVAVIEYFVVPELVGASKNLHLLAGLNVTWLIAGVVLEGASLVCYALLTRVCLPQPKPTLWRLLRIVLSTTAASHVIPGGAVGGTGLGFELLTSGGVSGPDAAFALATQAVGSAVVLNVLLWLSLLISIPLAGLHPIYVVIALLGLLLVLSTAALVYTFTRGEESAVRVIRGMGRRIPRVGPDRLEHLVRQLGASAKHFTADRRTLRQSLLWAAANWLLDAASLASFVAAFGHYVDPIELFAAYGIANVLAAIPITPGGLGVVEASSATLLVSFGVTRNVATLAVLGWRLVNFWLPIPLGAIAYLTLRHPRGARLNKIFTMVGAMVAGARASRLATGDHSPVIGLPPTHDNAAPGSDSRPRAD